ncbi:MAG: CAAX protease [Leptolyngbyaceae cyanobacterium bins.302]|nr:CAAX protease [Leptolyngbyaceae cyanobacterium bins.302]
MNETALSQASDLIGGAFGLSQEAFQRLATLPGGLWLALLVVLFAGFSLAIGQSIVLFVNRVRPERFAFSLLLNAILFTIGYIFLVLSTWLITFFPGAAKVSLLTLFKVLGLAYAPLLFSFLSALPHVGYPLQNLFSIWNLLAMVVAFAAVANTKLSSALGYVVIGWVIKQLLENTIGQPIAQLGRKLANQVAGVELVDGRSELKAMIAARTRPATPIGLAAYQPHSPEVRQLLYASGRGDSQATQAVVQAMGSNEPSDSPLQVLQSNLNDSLMQLEQRSGSIPKPVLLGLSLLGMGIIFILTIILLRPIRDTLFGWHDSLPRVFQWLFDLAWIGVVALVFAGFLAPLETLGWWAGWFGDDLDTTSADAIEVDPPPPDASLPSPTISRYVVYLDGIAQSGEEYTPDVEDFLIAFKPALPPEMKLVSGLMMYSVLNKPLDEDRPLAWLWKTADKLRWQNPADLLGLMLNLRNVLIVAVSADKRYGPIYNQGIAQVLFDGLVKAGYRPGSGTPITLIGYSGGGQMAAASAAYLKYAMGAPIDVISLGGVMSANNNILKLEQLYHVVGELDMVERIGPLIFPGRWKMFPLSYWNRAKRRGNISIISAGPVGHQVPGGYMDPKAVLPDGRTHLQQTIETILKILRGDVFEYEQMLPRKLSNYALYQQAEFVHPAYYPIDQTVDATLYRPLGQWMGRLILPQLAERHQVRGCLFEVHHAPEDYQHLVGQVVNLRWMNDPIVQKMVQAVTKDVHFSADSEYAVKYGGSVHPDRLNHWQQVDPLESLAGSRPVDDMIVMLNQPVQVEAAQTTTAPAGSSLYIGSTPVQITGRYYGIVQFVRAIAPDQYQVVHFNPASRQFDAATETVLVPSVQLAEAYGSYPSSTRNLDKVSLNEQGWYIYGAKNANGQFVVQSLAPRALLRVQPDRIVIGRKAARQYILKESWANAADQAGTISSVLCVDTAGDRDNQTIIDGWQEGDRALVVHTYGGIGGTQKEPAAATPIFFGHFAYGVAKVIRDPLSQELRFDIRYHQVYTQNTDGLVAGTLHWSRYMGDRQFGWAGSRPTCDLLIKLDAFTDYYDFNGVRRSPLNSMLTSLEVMTARYRIGDGTGGTFVGPANNCSQDSNQALFACLHQMETSVRANWSTLQAWTAQHPRDAQRFHQLLNLQKDLKHDLQPLGGPRSDWDRNEFNLGSTLEDSPIHNLLTGLGSWRTMFPRFASDKIARIFLKHGAEIWVLRTNQIGGDHPEIAPIAPTSMSFF